MTDSLTPEQLCRAAVDHLIARYGWLLLNRDEFARRTLEHIRAGIAADPVRAAIYTYSHALHMACSGAEGDERQELSYTELSRYLYDSARRRYSDVAEDAAQSALERTFTAFERCRLPGTFLAFALRQLMDAARALRRHANHQPLHPSLPDQPQADPANRVIADEMRWRFELLAAEFLRKHPRSAQQFAALRLKFIDGLDEVAISQRLGKPVPSVYVLRSRAIEKLRVEPEWRALAGELGILPEDRS